MKDPSQKVKQLSSLIFKPLALPQCPQHTNLYKFDQFICLKSSCKSYMSLFCIQCVHSQSHLFEIQKIVPILSQLLQQKWQYIRKQNIEIQSYWKTCEVNLKYCIDILTEVRKIVIESKTTRLHQLPIFQSILDTAMEMYRDGVKIEDISRNIQLLNNKYGLFENANNQNLQGKDKYKKIDSRSIDMDIEFRREKWLKMGQKTKQFSEKALAFSQTLAQVIQDRLKYEKRKQNLQQITANKIATLKELIKQYQQAKNDEPLSSKMQQLSSLKIQLPSNVSSSKSSLSVKSNIQQEQNYLQENLQKCQNLTTLFINNKNGKIPSKMWQIVISKFEYLKNLKQLRLHLRLQDLILLTKLFKQRPHAVRHISILYLTITDEPKLDAKLVSQFCNTLELRQLYLTLTRDNISKSNFIQFLNTLRIKTSLSFLPMNILEINLAKNKIDSQTDAIECENKFMAKCKQIKKKSILL